ncbi:MAG: class I tRNA ligase family protein, partial [Desulfurococcaceae archaeon]
FKPEMHKRRLIEWINSISMDWPITKDRFYATEVPMWRCKKCGSTLVPEPGKYYRPWIEEPPWENCPACGAPKSELEGERKVFDTWFDSSISVLYVTGFLRDPDLFEKAFPNTVRPQGIDIVRTWLYYTILRVYQLTGRPAFKWIRLTGMGLDEKGEAMHKSKGNVIDPEPFIEKYGADAFRFWAAASAKLGYDYRFSEQLIKTGLLFATKLWNIARFISSFPKPREPGVLKPIDKATLAKLGRLIAEVDKWYSELDVYTPINEIYQFTWNYFASNYVELVKSRAYNRDGKFSKSEQEASWHVLHVVIDAVLRMLAPIMPFVTDSIYRRLYGRSIHRELFPEASDEWLKWDDSLADKLVEVNSAIWSYKKQRGIKFSESLKGVVLFSKSIEPLIDELIVLHNIERFREYVGEPPDGCIKLSNEVCVVED